MTAITTWSLIMYNWHKMGIDPDDIVWLMEFHYHQTLWNENLVCFSINCVAKHLEEN